MGARSIRIAPLSTERKIVYRVLSTIFEGESRLFGFLGANVTLGGARVALEKSDIGLQSFMPCLANMLVVMQILVALATLVYMVLKVRRVWKGKRDE
jgi:hypothetical protein